MPPRQLLAASPAAVALSLAVLAAPASAATVATAPCVATVFGQIEKTVQIAGTGFTPGGFVNIAYTTQAGTTQSAASATADAAGNFLTSAYPASYTDFRTQEQPFGLVAVDRTNQAITATTTFAQVRFGFNASPEPKRPTSKVTYTARGFPGVGQPIYMHFRFGGKTRRNVKLGTASAPCGVAKRKMRALPAKTRYGKWTVYVDQSPKFSKATKPQVKDSFVIYRRFV